jgi:hypothetical protein
MSGPGRSDDDILVYGSSPDRFSWVSGGTSGVPSVIRHDRTVPLALLVAFSPR